MRKLLHKIRSIISDAPAAPAAFAPTAPTPGAAPPPSRPLLYRPPEPGPDFIDVKQLMKTYTIEELCQTAEDYFRDIVNPMGLVAKPFRTPNEVPHHLVRFCQVAQGLKLAPGMTVMDFGAGPGWASRLLTQMGCKVILSDVSPSALDIARTLYEQLPPLGDVPPPTFLHFDGRKIDLPDGSVDRIFCFDAFHHIPNPDEVLAELGRVLAVGGIAGFSEPGPYHSRSNVSQSEMRSFRVVENDIRIEEIWESAQQAGFDDLRLAVYYVPPFHLSLHDFDAFLHGGAPLAHYAEAVRVSMEGNRLFFLYKGFAGDDSRNAPQGLRCQLTVTLDATEVGGTITGIAEATNTGTSAWRIAPTENTTGQVHLGCHLLAADGKLLDNDFYHGTLPSEGGMPIPPGQSISIPFTLPPLPPDSGDRVQLAFDLVSEQLSWFADTPIGSPPIVKEWQTRTVS